MGHNMKYIKLFDAGQIPAIGLGTWKSDPQLLQQAVTTALEIGYQHLDCAAIYHNEAVIGGALQQALSTKTITREQLWVTSKLWNSYHRPADVLPALKATLAALQLDYLDLYLMHWPVAFAPHVGLAPPHAELDKDFLTLEQAPLHETWQAMEALVTSGLVRYIGVSNFSARKLADLLPKTTIQPAVNQIENHPYLAQYDLLDYCQKNQILVTAYAPLGSGDRATKANDEPHLLTNKTITLIAEQHQSTAAQILLAWQLQRGIIVIPKSTNATRIAENLAALDIQLSNNEITMIDQLNQDYRYIKGTIWEGRGSPYTGKNIFS